MNVTGLDVIAHSTNFDSVGGHVALRPWQWQLLHACDGRTELRDLAMHCGVDLDAAIRLVEEMQEAGLVRAVTLSLEEYRRWTGADAIASPAADRAATRDDHFSGTEVLAAYERPIPAWMIEPEPSPADRAAAAPVWREAEPVACADEAEPLAAGEAESAVHAYETDSAAHAIEAQTVADANETEPVAADEAQPFAVHDRVPGDESPSHDDEPVAGSYGSFEHLLREPVAQNAVPEHDTAVEATVLSHEESAAQAVADLVARPYESTYSSYEHYTSASAAEPAADAAPAYDAEHGVESAAEPERPPLSLSFGEIAPQPVFGNGHAVVWEPLSLLTSVDDDHRPLESDSFLDPSMPNGVSISLSPSTPAAAREPEREEKGSVSFTLSPDHTFATHAISPEPEHAQPHGDAVAEQPAAYAEDALLQDSGHAPQAAAEPAEGAAPAADVTSMPAGVYVTAKEPARAGGVPPAAPATSSTTADIVGSLISRALTFRIK